MTEAEFRALAAQGHNRIPLVLETFADLDTPLSLYVKLANAPHTFLLESVVGGERFGRYSFIGLPARTRIRARGTAIEVDERRRRASSATTAIRWPSSASSCAASAPRRDPGCRASAAGSPATSATTRCATSRRRLAHSAPPAGAGLDDVPDLLLLLTEELAVVDNLAGQDLLIVYADPAQPEPIATGAQRLAGAAPHAARAGRDPVRDRRCLDARRASEFGAERFQGAVRARQGIHRRRRHHAGRAVAAPAPAVHVVAAVALPRAALAQSVAVHVLLRLRRLPRRRRLAGDPGAQGRRHSHAAADRRHAAARRDARRRRRARARARSPTRRSAPST